MIRHWLVLIAMLAGPAAAQTPPSEADLRIYAGLHDAAARGDAAEIEQLIVSGEKPNIQDARSRTPLIVAAHFRRHDAARALLRLGANPNALDFQRYDIVTIASVNDDAEMLKLALDGGANPRAVTSPYAGTALIAAAHLGHAGIVQILIDAGAPLDRVNNLGWTALTEAIVLGTGGPNHTATVAALLKAGADPNIADRQRQTPLTLARSRGYGEMARLIEAAGGH